MFKKVVITGIAIMAIITNITMVMKDDDKGERVNPKVTDIVSEEMVIEEALRMDGYNEDIYEIVSYPTFDYVEVKTYDADGIPTGRRLYIPIGGVVQHNYGPF